MDSNDLKSIARVYTTLNEGFSQRLKARTSGTLSGLGHRIGGRAQELAGEFQQDTANLASKLSDSLTTSGEQRLEKGAAMRERGVAMGQQAKYRSYATNITMSAASEVINDLAALGLESSEQSKHKLADAILSAVTEYITEATY